MIILSVAEDKKIKDSLSQFFNKYGYSIIHYTHPLKALDNIDEISPDIFICSSSDFPRHWKLMVKQIREKWDRNKSVIVLTETEEMESEEADKAAFLGVNILFPWKPDNKKSIEDLMIRIRRYKNTQGSSGLFTWKPAEDEKVLFIFQHPLYYHFVSGKLLELSPAGGIFQPDDKYGLEDLDPGTIIEGGSMKAGSSLISIKARIISNTGNLVLAFLDFDGNGFQDLLRMMNTTKASV